MDEVGGNPDKEGEALSFVTRSAALRGEAFFPMARSKRSIHHGRT